MTPAGHQFVHESWSSLCYQIVFAINIFVFISGLDRCGPDRISLFVLLSNLSREGLVTNVIGHSHVIRNSPAIDAQAVIHITSSGSCRLDCDLDHAFARPHHWIMIQMSGSLVRRSENHLNSNGAEYAGRATDSRSASSRHSEAKDRVQRPYTVHWTSSRRHLQVHLRSRFTRHEPRIHSLLLFICY